jgi:hypothetical protein
MYNDLGTTVEASELPWCQLTNYLRPHLKYSACLFQNTAPVIVDTEDFDNEQLEPSPNKMRTLMSKPVWCSTFVQCRVAIQ